MGFAMAGIAKDSERVAGHQFDTQVALLLPQALAHASIVERDAGELRREHIDLRSPTVTLDTNALYEQNRWSSASYGIVNRAIGIDRELHAFVNFQ